MRSLARLRPTLLDLGLAAGLGALWCLHLLDGFAPNTARDAALVAAAYWLAHSGVCLLGLLVLRAPLALWLARRGRTAAGAARTSRALAGLALLFGLVCSTWLALAIEPGSEPPLPAPRAARSIEPDGAGTGEPATVAWRVRWIAMDGLDLGVLAEHFAAGELPHFERLIAAGASGPLRTLSPHSPIVWTSLATGRPPSLHGIAGYYSLFLEGTAVGLPVHADDYLGRALDGLLGFAHKAPVSSNERRVKALWEVLSDLGRASLVINWWASYPAEPIQGAVVSNLAIPWMSFSESELAQLEQQQHLVHPAGLQPEVARLVRAAVEREGALDLQRDDRTLAGSRFFAVRDRIAFELLERLSQPGQVLRSTYVQGIDTASHAYTQLVFGPNIDKLRPERVPAPEARRLWDELVGAAIRRMDAALGAQLDSLAADECLVVTSDHGWAYDGTSHWRLPPGACLFYGAPFEPGARLRGAHVLDILPTLAYLLDVPISRELEGRLLAPAFAQDFRAAREPAWVDAYGPRGARIQAGSTGADDDHLERLRQLGYVK